MIRATNGSKLNIAVTLGDPAGIGTEIVLKALADKDLVPENCLITLIGTRSLLEGTYQHLCETSHLEMGQLADPRDISILDIAIDNPDSIKLGQGNAVSGEASFKYLQAAIDLTLEGKFNAIVTAPIAKYLWLRAGYNYPGQTEVLANSAKVDRYGMLFVGRSPHTGFMLRTLLATTHIPLSQVSSVLNSELMSKKLDLLVNCLRTDFGIDRPKIVISGLNPHSGENGQLGTEEQNWLIPWLEQQRKDRPDLELIGPVPPDTMWVKPGLAWYEKATRDNTADAYLALYHDQGLIPVKLMAFDRAINTTIGLPFIRTSPDHGTAFDIAGFGVADPNSIKAAISLGIELAARRQNSLI